MEFKLVQDLPEAHQGHGGLLGGHGRVGHAPHAQDLDLSHGMGRRETKVIEVKVDKANVSYQCLKGKSNWTGNKGDMSILNLSHFMCKAR
jgi:hypothetical protein